MQRNEFMITLVAARANHKNEKQWHAAKGLKINRATLSNYETGKTSPDCKFMEQAELYYGVPKGMLKAF